MKYEMVRFDEVAKEIIANLERHYDDVAHKDDYGRPDLDWESYLAQSMAGNCVAITARDDGELVGYSVFVIGPNMNHKTRIEAANTGLFIAKAYRGKITLAFIKQCDAYLKQLGVQEVSYVLKDERIGRLLTRADYRPSHMVWSNVL